MKYTEDFLNFLLDQLSVIEDVTHKKMFGGVGFFKEGKMFAGIFAGTFAMKVNDSNRADYEAKGMGQALADKKAKGKGMPYYEVPVEIIEDQSLLKNWAEKSIAIALKKN
jgi:DNA transformation protein